MQPGRRPGSGRGPRWCSAIARIRDAGLRDRRAHQQLDPPPTAPARRRQRRARRRSRSTSWSSRRSKDCASPTRASTTLVLERDRVSTRTEAVFLDDLGINLKPATRDGHGDDQGRPTRRRRCASSKPSSVSRSMASSWHGPAPRPPRRTGAHRAGPRHARRPGAHRPRARAGGAARRRGSRTSRSTRSCRARNDRARETAAPIAAAHGLDVEIVDGLVEYDVQADDYIPIEELKATNDPRWHAMVEGRW